MHQTPEQAMRDPPASVAVVAPPILGVEPGAQNGEANPALMPSLQSGYQLKDPASDYDASSVRAEVGTPPRQQNPASASLEKYILQAEQYLFFRQPDRDVFTRTPGVQAPRLERGRSNRIIVFTGCFNPPHRGHRELLLHTYLRTDSKTIAAMVVPRDDDGLGHKHHLESLSFTKQQRKRLWQDDILQRFAWLFPGSHRDVNDSIKRMRKLAKADGFSLTFTTLRGSDHTNLTDEPCWSGGTGSMITSDITRPSRLLHKSDGEPHQVVGCNRWRKILPAKSVKRPDGVNACWPCWPCWKLSKIYPPFQGMRVGMDCFVDDLLDILQRCHQGRGTLWSASRPGGGCLWFFPSGRHYPIDERRPPVSSTMVRELLVGYNGDHVALYERLRQLVFNPGCLITTLRLNKCWLPRDDSKGGNWERVSSSGKADDDWDVAARNSAVNARGRKGQHARWNSV